MPLFISFFMNKVSYQTMTAAGSTDREGDNQPGVGEQIRNYLKKLDIFKSAGPDEMQPRILKQLAEVFAELLTILLRSHGV